MISSRNSSRLLEGTLKETSEFLDFLDEVSTEFHREASFKNGGGKETVLIADILWENASMGFSINFSS
jgi:hypothetical protein